MSDDIAAVAFDAFALFDARPVFQACETVAPGRGSELASLWRTRQFEYQWLRALGQRYEAFYAATEAALDFANNCEPSGAAPPDSCVRSQLAMPLTLQLIVPAGPIVRRFSTGLGTSLPLATTCGEATLLRSLMRS